MDYFFFIVLFNFQRDFNALKVFYGKIPTNAAHKEWPYGTAYKPLSLGEKIKIKSKLFKMTHVQITYISQRIAY